MSARPRARRGSGSLPPYRSCSTTRDAMTLLSDVTYRLRALLRRGRMDAELAAELEHHVATQAAARHGLSGPRLARVG
jgi:hypothetical protein